MGGRLAYLSLSTKAELREWVAQGGKYETVQEAHHSVLHQLLVMEPYVEKHLEEIRVAQD
jgi:hypothetical protein